MSQEKEIRVRITKAFKDGELIPADEQTVDITKTAVTFPEGIKTATVSIGRDFPMMVYGFGGNAKASVHISVPCVLEKSELEDAVKFATKICDRELEGQKNDYLGWLDSMNVDWEKVTKAMK